MLIYKRCIRKTILQFKLKYSCRALFEPLTVFDTLIEVSFNFIRSKAQLPSIITISSLRTIKEHLYTILHSQYR